MKIKAWVSKIQQKLIMAGTKRNEATETQIAMVTLNEQQGRSQNNSSGNDRSHRGNRTQRPDNRRYKGNADGSLVTECGFCDLIQGKDVSQEYLKMGFNERHRNLSHRTIWANNCLPWLKLSFDVLQGPKKQRTVLYSLSPTSEARHQRQLL